MENKAGEEGKTANPDQQHFDKMVVKELAWKLDREVWAHVQNPNPSEEWSTSKARERTRELLLEYIGDLDAVKALLLERDKRIEELQNDVEYNVKRALEIAKERDVLEKVNAELTEREKEILSHVSGRLWTEASYDPYNEDTRKFAEPLSALMMELNQTLKFKK